MTYVDAYVGSVKTAEREKYKTISEKMSAIFKDHGALKVMENWGVEVPDGELTSFPMAVKKKADETVVIGWIVWPSKEARDEGMPKAMSDERFGHSMQETPLDGKRMIFGGFETLVEV